MRAGRVDDDFTIYGWTAMGRGAIDGKLVETGRGIDGNFMIYGRRVMGRGRRRLKFGHLRAEGGRWGVIDVNCVIDVRANVVQH